MTWSADGCGELQAPLQAEVQGASVPLFARQALKSNGTRGLVGARYVDVLSTCSSVELAHRQEGALAPICPPAQSNPATLPCPLHEAAHASAAAHGQPPVLLRTSTPVARNRTHASPSSTRPPPPLTPMATHSICLHPCRVAGGSGVVTCVLSDIEGGGASNTRTFYFDQP